MQGNSDLTRHVDKYYGKYSGEVTDNQDTDKVGKVKVKVPSVFGADLEVIARPCMPFGHFYVPAVGAKVWVEFEAGDPNYPIYVGVWYPAGSTPADAALNPPDNRTIQTPSGHTIELQDKDGEEKILIKHKDNSFISIDKNGSVLVSNQKGSYMFLNSDKGELSLVEQDGHLISMTSKGILLINKDSSMVELNGDTARIAAKNVVLQGTTITAGQNAAEPTILGQTFMTNWNMFIFHTHPTALGPSGPPIPPAQPLAPGNGLTSSLLVK